VENSPSTIDNILEQATPKVQLDSATVRAIPPTLAGLFTPSASQNGEPALFDDTVRNIRDVPGTLHHQSDEHVEHLLAKTGAVALVKQLAQDLAQRDAEITLLQRKAEERESLLRKMLRECEVSNMDIENRLGELRKLRARDETQEFGGELRKAKDQGARPEASIRDRLIEALGDELQPGRNQTFGEEAGLDKDATMVRHRRAVERVPPHAISTVSVESAGTSKSGTTRGWKGLFGYGGSDKLRGGRSSTLAGSHGGKGQTQHDSHIVNNSRDKHGASKTLESATDQTRSNESITSETRARVDSGTGSTSTVSSQSIASWALRMVAGTLPEEAGQPQTRSRASTVSVPGSKPWKASKVKPNMAINPAGANTTAKGSAANMLGPPSPVTSEDAACNLGPVEMDAIVPDEKLPPTLMQYNNYSRTEFMTDRFGFIYDQRRRRRHNEAAAALPSKAQPTQAESAVNHRHSVMSARQPSEDNDSILSQTPSTTSKRRPETPLSTEDADDAPAKRWQDYLSLSVFGSELLSHTPAAAPITEVTEEQAPAVSQADPNSSLSKKRSSLSMGGTTSALSAPEVISDHADLAASATLQHDIRPPSSSSDPVKALLDQVNDVHDALQRQKVIKWNEFLRKVRVGRKREGEQGFAFGLRSKSNHMPETMLLDGEVIGVAGLGVKGKVGRAKGNEFRSLVLGGIPVTYRAKIWAECCGASTMRVPGYYEELVNSTFNDETIVQQIQMDITRTLTDNIFFRAGLGITKLNEVLLAYARRNPDIGYCQGMNLITANLLLLVPTAEDAFWILTSIIENILPPKYFNSSLLTSRADQVVLRQYVSAVLPALSTHLETLSIDLEAVTFQWFLSIFTDCLSAEALFRVWDVLFCLNDGATFLFQVALALLKLNEGRLLMCESPAEVYAYINQKMTDHAISIDGLIRASEALKKEVRREDVAERRQEAVDRELEMVQQREAIRRGKGKARSSGQSDSDAFDTTDLLAAPKGAPKGSNASLHDTGLGDALNGLKGKLTRQSSRVSFGLSTRDEEDLDLMEQSWGELERVTPMPMDEECLWR